MAGDGSMKQNKKEINQQKCKSSPSSKGLWEGGDL